MNDEVVVRRAVAAHREDLWRLLGQLAISRTPERSAFDVGFDTLLGEASSLVAVAESGEGPVVGYVVASIRTTLIANGQEAWVGELVVDEGVRGRGIGGALMAAAEAWAASRGARQVTLATSRAQTFYEAHGYEARATYFKKALGPGA